MWLNWSVVTINITFHLVSIASIYFDGKFYVKKIFLWFSVFGKIRGEKKESILSIINGNPIKSMTSILEVIFR